MLLKVFGCMAYWYFLFVLLRYLKCILATRFSESIAMQGYLVSESTMASAPICDRKRGADDASGKPISAPDWITDKNLPSVWLDG